MTEREIEEWFANNPKPNVELENGFTRFTRFTGDWNTIVVFISKDGDLRWELEE